MAKAAKKVEIPSTPAKQDGGVDVALLRAVSAATREGSFVYLSVEGKPLVDLALVVVDLSVHDENGNPAAKTTEAGESFLESLGGEDVTNSGHSDHVEDELEAEQALASSKPSFEISSGFTIPEVKRASGGGAVSIYPFEKLEVGQFFFIPNSAKKPHAAKDYASTVSSANGRLQPKRFKIVPAFDASGKEIGANVGRLPDYDDAGLQAARERSARRAAARQATKAAKSPQPVPQSEPAPNPFIAA